MALAAGTRLGPYEIVTPLGAGGPAYARVKWRVAAALKYRDRGVAYRVHDDVMDAVLGDCQVDRFTGEAGSVLFLDSNRCFHCGSRRPARPRYHMQYAYLSPCRTDFGDIRRRQVRYATAGTDSRLRRLVLDRDESVERGAGR